MRFAWSDCQLVASSSFPLHSGRTAAFAFSSPASGARRLPGVRRGFASKPLVSKVAFPARQGGRCAAFALPGEEEKKRE